MAGKNAQHGPLLLLALPAGFSQGPMGHQRVRRLALMVGWLLLLGSVIWPGSLGYTVLMPLVYSIVVLRQGMRMPQWKWIALASVVWLGVNVLFSPALIADGDVDTTVTWTDF